MEFELKTLSPEAVARALAKAERYRLLNEPGEAESICLDALEVEPDNQDGADDAAAGADRSVRQRLVVGRRSVDDRRRGSATSTSAPTTPASSFERRAKAQARGTARPGCGPQAYEWLREAMTLVREGRSAASRRQRRCAAAVERVRAADHARSPSRAERGRAGRTDQCGVEHPH